MIRMNFAALEAAVADIDEVTGAMDITLAELNSSLNTKLAEWDGGAHGSYEQTKTMWMNAARDIKALLNAIRVSVENSKQRMVETELRNSQRLGRFVSG